MDNKSNLYERLLDQLTKDKSTSDKSNVSNNLLAAILKKKLDSNSSVKNVKSKISRTKSKVTKKTKNLVNSKQKHQFKPHRVQDDENIKELLKHVLSNSINVKSLPQVMKTQPPKKDWRLQNERKQKQPQTVTPKPSTKHSMTDLLKKILPNVLTLSNLGKQPLSPTQQPTKTAREPTTSDQKENVQIANLLKKFGIQNNKKAVDISGRKHMDNLLKSANSNIQIHKIPYTVSPAADVTTYKATTPSPHLLPPPPPPQLKSPPSLQLKSPEPSSPTQQQQGQQPQQQQQQQQQQKISTLSPNLPYLNPEPNQEQADTQRSVIPTPKRQQTIQISQASQAVPIPQRQQQLKSSYGYPAYSSSNNNLYGSYQTQQSTNVLCFGDSLTSGYYNHGRGKHPYSIRLNQLLDPEGSHHYHIETRGVVGEMVHGSMTKRLPKVLNEGRHFDWVLILGGTNDVAHVKNFGDDEDFTRQLISVWSPKIVKDIKKLHEIARRYGARTMLMTIPETAYELWHDFRSIRNMRLSVNAALRKYATEVRDTTVLCDLAYKLPRSTLSKEMQKFYWNDHIHLNPIGYDKMAEIIQQCLQPYLT